MTWLLWLGGAVGVLAVIAIALRMVGAERWADLIRTHTSQLESGRVDVQSARFDARELEGLPAPVQRYFRAVFTDGQPIIAAATIEMAGTIASIRADARGADVGKDVVMLPWGCVLPDDQPQDGMSIPMRGEAAWMRPDGRKAYFVGHVEKLRYEFAR